MHPFLQKFFPDVYAHVTGPSDDGSSAYCKYNNQGLQLFTSSLFIAGMVGGILGGWTTRHGNHMPTLDWGCTRA